MGAYVVTAACKGLTSNTVETAPRGSVKMSLKGFSRPWTSIRWHSSFASSSVDRSARLDSQSNRARPKTRRVRVKAAWRTRCSVFCGGELHCLQLTLDTEQYFEPRIEKRWASVSDVVIRHLHVQTPLTLAYMWVTEDRVLIMQCKVLTNALETKATSASVSISLWKVCFSYCY